VDDLISMLTLEEKPYLLVARESPKGNISRLGIPEYDWGANCIHGVQSRCAPDGRCATSFPDPNQMGSSFNKTMWRGLGSVIGVELRALWLQNVSENHEVPLPHLGLDCWSPNVGIQRDVRWGRNLETPSGGFNANICSSADELPCEGWAQDSQSVWGCFFLLAAHRIS
jgi:beta-glucosidase-like glycosyl hydrolase